MTRVRETSAIAGLKLNIKMTTIMATALRGRKIKTKQKQSQILFTWFRRSHRMVSTVIKYKNGCFWEGRLPEARFVFSKVETSLLIQGSELSNLCVPGGDLWTLRKSER